MPGSSQSALIRSAIARWLPQHLLLAQCAKGETGTLSKASMHSRREWGREGGAHQLTRVPGSSVRPSVTCTPEAQARGLSRVPENIPEAKPHIKTEGCLHVLEGQAMGWDTRLCPCLKHGLECQPQVFAIML